VRECSKQEKGADGAKVIEWTSVMLKATVGPAHEGKMEKNMSGGNDFRKPKQY